tara:strand:- start:3053 stop:3328 length:276 start_codon:yes stop_codon:yes gene_type:complete
MQHLKKTLLETLSMLGGKKGKDSIDFLKPSLVIKRKDCGVKYTVKKVVLQDENNKKPFVVAYRYYGMNPNKPKKKVYIKIYHNDFNKYEPV